MAGSMSYLFPDDINFWLGGEGNCCLFLCKTQCPETPALAAVVVRWVLFEVSAADSRCGGSWACRGFSRLNCPFRPGAPSVGGPTIAGPTQPTAALTDGLCETIKASWRRRACLTRSLIHKIPSVGIAGNSFDWHGVPLAFTAGRV